MSARRFCPALIVTSGVVTNLAHVAEYPKQHYCGPSPSPAPQREATERDDNHAERRTKGTSRAQKVK